jgi:hypothetical protein
LANDISANPWKIDTASATAVYNFPMKIDNVIWANAAVGATLLVQDVNGKDIIRATETSGIADQHFGKIGWVRGLVVPTLSSGELTIAIGAGR